MAGASSVVVAEAGSAKAEIVETRYGEIRSRSGAQLRFTPAMQELCMTSGGYMVVLLFRHGVADAELRRCRDRRRARAGRSPRLARSEHQRRTLRVDGPSTHDRLGRIRRTGRLWSGVVDEPSCGRTRPPPSGTARGIRRTATALLQVPSVFHLAECRKRRSCGPMQGIPIRCCGG